MADVLLMIASYDPLSFNALEPEARVEGISTMAEVVGRAFAPWRFSTIVVSAFGAIALTFAAVGIAALVAHIASRRFFASP
ncbi:MAG TPA: hypothetical protein VH740_11490 [Vicinamibacterales bacterium]